MKKKWWLAIGVIVVLAFVVALAIFALVPPTPGVTYANYSRIQTGMQRGEVEAILGEPERLYALQVFGQGSWHTEAGDVIVVTFDKEDRVASMTWNYAADSRTNLEKVRDRLPWIAKPPPDARRRL